jgi:signal transduction histidine kinase
LRKRYESTIHQKAVHSEALARVAARINAQMDLQNVMQTICEEIAPAMNYAGCTIMLFDEELDSYKTVANTLKFASERTASISREQYEGLLSAFGPVIVIPDISSMQNAPHQELAAIRKTRTIVGVPLSQDGKLVGNLSVYSTEEIHLPTEEELSLLKGFADQASIAIAKASLFEQISEGHKRLQALSEKLVKVQEEERSRLARELHDEIGQILTLLSLNCDMISKTLRDGGYDHKQIIAQFDDTKQMVNNLLNQVRELSLELRPGILDDLGLLPALLDHFKHYSSQSNIEVQFRHHGLKGRYSADVETTVFRIVQEALTNVARHAKVDTVSVHLWKDRDYLKLKIEDQGAGFDLDAVERANNSIGISSMRERAILCGGELEIETAPGRGTCLTVELPLVAGLTRSENVHFDTAGR